MGPISKREALHVLVDIPNVTNSLRDVSCKREGDFTAFDRTRLSLRNLYRLAHTDRPVAGSLWAGLDRQSLRWLRGAIRAFAPAAEIDLRLPERDDDGEQQITDLVLERAWRAFSTIAPGCWCSSRATERVGPWRRDVRGRPAPRRSWVGGRSARVG